MNRIVNQAKQTSGRDGAGIRCRLTLLAAILGLFMASVPGPISVVAAVFGAGGVEVLSLRCSAPEQFRKAAALKAYGELPLSFELNQGQMNPEVKLLSRGSGYKLFLTPTEAVLVLRQQAAGNKQKAKGKIEGAEETGSELETRYSILETTLRMKLVGANPNAQMAAEEMVSRVHYLIGNDPSKWRSNIPTYAKVRYRDVYPGAEMVYYGQHGQLEYDFIVAPGADPTAIRLAFEGADRIEIDTHGDLVLHTAAGEIRLRRPIVYQKVDGVKQPIASGYVLVEPRNSEPETRNLNPSATLRTGPETQQVGFQLAAYDASKPLVIDPVLSYSTYLGGSGNNAANGIAVDSEGHVYVTGSTDSTNFPAVNAFQGAQGGVDAFVAKLGSDGSILYSTYLGGSGDDIAHGVAVDSEGHVYVTGSTDSTKFPVKRALQRHQGGKDAFVTTLNPARAGRRSLLYSTYLGGRGDDAGLAIAASPGGKAYVTGITESNDFPLKKPLQEYQGGTDAFLARLNPALSRKRSILYSTYVGGSGNDSGLGIAVDVEGNAYVTGITDSPDFPTLHAVQDSQGGTKAFVTKADVSGSDKGAVVYSTYLGGSGKDEGHGIAVDAVGNAYVTGLTESGDFPTLPGLAVVIGGLQNAFVAKVVQPDLVNAAFAAPSKGGAGSSITVNHTTLNQGEAPAETSETKFYLSTDAILDAGDVPLGAREIPVLASGESSEGSIELAIPSATAAGSYYLLAKVDAENVVAEALEDNNKSKRAIEIIHGPDLILSYLSAAALGSTITVTDTVKNQGVIFAEASTTKFYLSTDVSLDGADVLLGNRAIPPLAAGATDSGSTTIAIPADMEAGDYLILAVADAGNAVSEVNESNNTSAAPVAIKPDLIVSSLSVPSKASAGATISATDTTKNEGVVSAKASTTKLYLSPDQKLDSGDILLGARAIPALAKEATSTGSTALTIPAGIKGGTYYVLAQADADHANPESNEENNVFASKAIAIGPDLIISTLFAPSTAGPGSTIFVSNTTRNQGESPADPSTTKFYLSSDAGLDAGDIALGGRAVPALEPGGISVESTPLTIPATTAAGTYFIIAQADGDHAVKEGDEGNNTTVSNAIAVRGPDLVVSALAAPPTGTPGSTISVTDTTKNQGGSSAGTSTTKFYLSPDSNLDSTDLFLGSRAVAALAAGTSSSGSTALTLPAGIAGTYYILAQADGDNAVAEFSENNNVTPSNPIAVGPDLVIKGIATPSKAGAGLAISVNVTTKNQGVVASNVSTTKLFLSSDTNLDAGDILLGIRVVPPLAAGATDSGSMAITIPAATVTGVYYMIAYADADRAVTESNEGNNTKPSDQIKIGPDLRWDSLKAQPFTGTGSIIVVEDTVINGGGGAAAASTTKLFLSRDDVVDSGDVFLGSRALPALAPGEASSGSLSVTIPAGTPGGAYYLIAQADADNSVAELDEGNNIRTKALYIGPDLVAWLDLSGSATSGTLSPGSTVSITDFTKNDSSIPAGPSTTRFYLSTDTALDASDIAVGSRAIPELEAGATNSGSSSLTIPTGVGGAYYIIALADADNAITEWNETNNTTATARTILIGSDLVVWLDLPASFATAVPGSTHAVTDHTRNDSQSPAGGSTTKLYLSKDATLDPGDILLGSRIVPALSPGEISSASTSVILPPDLTGGNYYILAQADGDNAVAESNEGNNVAASNPFAIGPDLVVWPDLPAASFTAAAGSTISMNDTTRNAGLAPAGASTTRFYLSKDTTLDASDFVLGARTVPALAGGATSSATTTLALPAGVVGSYYIIAQADADNAVVEIDEGNNTSAFSNTILIGSDLIVWLDYDYPLHAPYPGKTISVSDITKNESSAPAGASATKFYLSTDATVDAGDVFLGGRTVPALAPGAMSSGVMPVTIPAETVPGWYYIIAQADADNAVAEFNESNNIQAKPIHIFPNQNGPDLVVWFDLPASATSTTLAAGSTIFIEDTTKNEGSDPAGATATKFYLSKDTTLDAGDIIVSARAVPPLNPGAASTGSNALAIPLALGGSYYIIAKADADNAVTEFHEANNIVVSSKTIRVGPDLVVWLDLPASATSSTLNAGSTIFISDITRNDSQTPAGASITKFYLSSDPVLDAADVLVGMRPVPALAPGEASSGTPALTLPEGVGGAYYILAVADGDNVIQESNEANNTTATSRTVFIGPDLIVWLDLPGASARAAASSTISINDVTKNESQSPAGSSTTLFFLSSDATLDASDIPLGSRPVPALDPGAQSAGSTPLTLPPGIAGTYHIIAMADGYNAVTESNEGNNVTASSPVAVGPDLVITGVTLGAMVPSADGAGLTLYVNDTTKNQGADLAGSSATKFFLSLDTILDAGDIFLGGRAIPALAPLEYSSGTTAVTISGATAAGSYYIIAMADADNAVAEASEGNNTYATVVGILPDLVVNVLKAPSKAYPAVTIAVSDTTKNLRITSPATTTRFFLSTDTVLDSGDTFIGERTVPALGQNEESEASTLMTLPSELVGGTYYIIAMADADNSVIELSEGNNIRYRTLTIGPDLTVADLSVPSTGAAASTISVTETTTNLGSPAPASTTNFYLSADATLDSGDLFLAGRAISALGLNESSSGSTELTLPAGIPGGTYFIIARADGDNTVAELFEGNNTKARTITISGSE